MNALKDQFPCILQQLGTEQNGAGRSIASDLILGGRGVDEHFCNGMLHFGGFKHRDTVVRDHGTPFVVDQQLVHATGAQRAADGSSQGHCGRDVVSKRLSSGGPCGLLQNGHIAHGLATFIFPIRPTP